MEKMVAARLYGKEDLRVEKIGVPEVGPNEILMKVEAATICASDIRAYIHGNGRVKLPRVLGHEFAGRIVKIGADLKERFDVGARITANPNMYCGRCLYCIQGKHELCKDRYALGVDVDGAFAEYMKIPKEAHHCGLILEIPDNVSFEEAALAEPLSACLHGQLFAPLRMGDMVTVIGTGPIGIMHVILAKSLGASMVIACDIDEQRLEQAKEFGADYIINSRKENLEGRIKEITEGHGSDFTVVAVSSAKVQQDALTIAANEGRINFFGGLPPGEELVPLNTNIIHYKELRVFGTFAQSIHEYEQALRFISMKRFPLKKLITHKYDLKDIDFAFRKAISKEGLKTCIIP